MQYIGIASRLLPFLGQFANFLTDKAKTNPKSGDAILAIGTAATAFGVSPETRILMGKIFMFIGQALQASV